MMRKLWRQPNKVVVADLPDRATAGLGEQLHQHGDLVFQLEVLAVVVVAPGFLGRSG